MGSRRKERLKGVYDALLGAADAPTPAPEDIPRPTPDAVSTPSSPGEPEHTPPHTPRHTPEHISRFDAEHDAGAPPAPTPAEEHTPPPARLPTPRDVMVRTQHFLRRDQIEWLDGMVSRHPGTTRSDFLRAAIDLYREMVEGKGEA